MRRLHEHNLLPDLIVKDTPRKFHEHNLLPDLLPKKHLLIRPMAMLVMVGAVALLAMSFVNFNGNSLAKFAFDQFEQNFLNSDSEIVVFDNRPVAMSYADPRSGKTEQQFSQNEQPQDNTVVTSLPSTEEFSPRGEVAGVQITREYYVDNSASLTAEQIDRLIYYDLTQAIQVGFLVGNGTNLRGCLQADAAGNITGRGTSCRRHGGGGGGGGGAAVGAVVSGATEGSILFAGANGAMSQDNSNFFWDDSANALGIGTNTPDASAALDISSTTKGALMPRMTTGERDLINSPATGLIVYNTSTDQFNYYDGGAWTAVASGVVSSTWDDITDPSGNLALSMGATTTAFTWNAATAASNLFSLSDTASNNGTGYLLNLATGASSTLKPLRVTVNGGATTALAVNSLGNVGVGTASPTARLHVVSSGAVTTANTASLISNTATSGTASIDKIGLSISSTGTWNGATANNYALKVSPATGGTGNYNIYSGTDYNSLALYGSSAVQNGANAFVTKDGKQDTLVAYNENSAYGPVEGMYVISNATGASGGFSTGITSEARVSSSAGTSNANAVYGFAWTYGGSNVSNAIGLSGQVEHDSSGTANLMASLYAYRNYNFGGTVTRNAGLYLEDQTPAIAIAANSYQIYSAGTNPFVVRADGNVGIGDTSPAALLTVGSGDLFQVNSTGQIGSQQAPVSDYLFSLAGTTGNDNSRIIDITQANNAAENSNVISIVNTPNAGTLNDDSRDISNISATLTPTIALTTTAFSSDLNISGNYQAITASGITFGNSAISTETAEIYTNQSSLNLNPVINDTTGGGQQYIYGYGFNGSITGAPTYTSVAGSAIIESAGGYFANGASSAGNANVTNTKYGVYGFTYGNLTTTGTTKQYGGRFAASGTADINYGLYADASGATVNYAAILTGGNVGIGTTAPDRPLEVNSATGLGIRLTYNDSDGTATNYSDLSVSSGGDLTIAPSGADTGITGALTVTGSANTSQLVIKANGTQSLANGMIVLQSSNGTPLLEISSNDPDSAFVGLNAGNALTNGDANTFIGSYVGRVATSADENTGVGSGALYFMVDGNLNTAVGAYALSDNVSGDENVAVGNYTLKNTVGDYGTGVGTWAGYTNSSGVGHALLGYEADTYNSTGSYNTMIGYQAGRGVGGQSHSNNVFLGAQAGYAVTTGSNNIAIGYHSGDNLTSGASNIIIGYNIDAPVATSSNQLSIGNLIFGTGIDGTGTSISSGNIGIGDITPDTRLDVEGDSASAYIATFFNDGNNANRYGIEIQAGADDASGTTYYLNALDGDGGQVGYIANTSGTFALTDVSDRRTKTNIENTEIDAMEILTGLRVVDFNRLANPDGPKITGFIAQEVQQVYPNIITESENGYLGITKENLIPVLVKGIQDQQGQIASLQIALNLLQGNPEGNLDSEQPLVLASHLYLTQDSVGETKILPGATSVRVTFDKPYQYQPIVTATPNSRVGSEYWIDDKDDTGFTLYIDEESDDVIYFNWHAFASSEAKLSVSDGSTENIPLVVAQPEPDPEVAGAQDPPIEEIPAEVPLEPESTPADPSVEPYPVIKGPLGSTTE